MNTTVITSESTVAETRAWLEEYREDGIGCPSCLQYVKVWKRGLNANMVKSVIAAYRAHGTEWFYAPDLVSRLGGDWARIRHWGLIEKMTEETSDNPQAGYWRVTETGAGFLLGKKTVPRYTMVYNNAVIDMSHDEQISVKDTLGKKDNYEELMGHTV